MPTAIKFKWLPSNVTDVLRVGQPSGRCQRCGKRGLRFLHHLVHPVEGTITVGCECARLICYGYCPDREERKLRNLWARRSRWLVRNWRVSQNGNEWLRIQQKHGPTARVVIVKSRFGGYSYLIAIGETETRGQWRGPYSDSDVAKLAAFDEMAEKLHWRESEIEA